MRKLQTVRPSIAWFIPCCLSVLITALLFLKNILIWDGGLPSGKNAIGAIFGNIICMAFLIIFETVDYRIRISGPYEDWRKVEAIKAARYLTVLGWVLGFIHTFYFITEWSRNW